MGVFEEYVKKVLKIPYCNFKGVDPKIAYEIIVGISLMYEMYPFFDRVICAINGIDDYNNHLNMLEYSDSNNIESLRPTTYHTKKASKDDLYSFGKSLDINDFDENNEFKLPLWINKNHISYFSLNICDTTKKLETDSITNLEHNNQGRAGIYHEFGHLLDIFLHISNNPKLQEIINNHNIKEEISEYACKNNKELVAEAFKYYILLQNKTTKLEKKLGIINTYNIKYNSLVLEIGKLIDEEYERFTKYRKIKFINERYNFNKKFTIVKNKINDIEQNELENKIKKLVLK